MLKAVKPPMPDPTSTPILDLSICIQFQGEESPYRYVPFLERFTVCSIEGTHSFKGFWPKAGNIKGPPASNQTVPPTVINTVIILSINVAFGGEVMDLTRKPNREGGSIKPINEGDSTFSLKKFIIKCVDVVTKNRNNAHSCNDNPFFGVCFSFGS